MKCTLQIKRIGSTHYQLAIFCDLCRSPQWSQKAKRRPNLIPWQLGSEALIKLPGWPLWTCFVVSPCWVAMCQDLAVGTLQEERADANEGFLGSEWYRLYRWYSSTNNRCRNKLQYTLVILSPEAHRQERSAQGWSSVYSRMSLVLCEAAHDQSQVRAKIKERVIVQIKALEVAFLICHGKITPEIYRISGILRAYPHGEPELMDLAHGLVNLDSQAAEEAERARLAQQEAAARVTCFSRSSSKDIVKFIAVSNSIRFSLSVESLKYVMLHACCSSTCLHCLTTWFLWCNILKTHPSPWGGWRRNHLHRWSTRRCWKQIDVRCVYVCELRVCKCLQ